MDMVERLARSMAERAIRVARRWDTDPAKLDEMIAGAVDYCWRDYEPDARAALDVVSASKPSDLILALPTETLVGIVMRLTGGSVNPELPRVQAERIKKETPAG